jgi:hypothetical protein
MCRLTGNLRRATRGAQTRTHLPQPAVDGRTASRVTGLRHVPLHAAAYRAHGLTSGTRAYAPHGMRGTYADRGSSLPATTLAGRPDDPRRARVDGHPMLVNTTLAIAKDKIGSTHTRPGWPRRGISAACVARVCGGAFPQSKAARCTAMGTLEVTSPPSDAHRTDQATHPPIIWHLPESHDFVV